MKNKIIFSHRSFIFVALLITTVIPVSFLFAEGDCANHPLGQQICQRALQQQNQDHDRLDLDEDNILEAQAIDDLGGNMNSAAGLTQTISNVSISDVSGENFFLGKLLSSLSLILGGSSGNIAGMFQNLGAGASTSMLGNQDNYYPDTSCYYDYRHCTAQFLAPLAYNNSFSGMNNFGNLGNVGNVSGQMFGGYNVASGNTGSGISSLLGLNSGSSSGIFGMFGGSNASNGSWLGTLLMTVGALTGNTNLIMAGQVMNTLSAMNQQTQALNQQQTTTGTGTTTNQQGLPSTGTSITGSPNYTGDGAGSSSIVKGDFSNVTASDLRPHLGSNYSDEDVQAFVDAGNQYGIDPRFLASVSKFETGNGTSAAFTDGRNNAMGTSNSTGPIGFGSVRESIFAQASSLSRENGYYSGATTIQQIGDIYSPSVNPATGKPYENDINGTNWSWAGNVSNNYNQMTNGTTGT